MASSTRTTFLVLSTLGVFFLGLLGGFFPSMVSERKSLLAHLNCLAGGVLLSAGLIHLVADGGEDLEGTSWFPLAELFAGIAILFLFTLQAVTSKLVRMQVERRDRMRRRESIQRRSSSVSTAAIGTAAPIAAWENLKSLTDEEKSPMSVSTVANGGRGSGGGAIDEDVQSTGRPSAGNVAMVPGTGAAPGVDAENRRDSAAVLAQFEDDFEGDMRDSVVLRDSARRMSVTRESVKRATSVVALTEVAVLGADEMSAVLIFAGLIVHGLFAGLAIGVGDVNWVLLAAIYAHKGLAAAALGSALEKSALSRSTSSACIVGFSAITPTGALIGYLAHSAGSDVVTGVCTSLAGGTFIFLSLTHILYEELAATDDHGDDDHGLAGLLEAARDSAALNTGLLEEKPVHKDNGEQTKLLATLLLATWVGFTAMALVGLAE